jgi:hypothetical protein
MKGAPADVIRTLALTTTSRHTPRSLALLDRRRLIARMHAMVQGGVVAPWRRMLTRKDETLGRSDDLLDLLALIAEHGP